MVALYSSQFEMIYEKIDNLLYYLENKFCHRKISIHILDYFTKIN
jgi:hypothetical protein